MDKYFTNVRPDVLREIDKRGHKTNSVGTNIGWGTNIDTLVLQKQRLKSITENGLYQKLLDKIVTFNPIKEDHNPPKKRQKRTGQAPQTSEMMTKWVTHCINYVDDDSKIPDVFACENMSITEFVESEIGRAVLHYSKYIKEKL